MKNNIGKELDDFEAELTQVLDEMGPEKLEKNLRALGFEFYDDDKKTLREVFPYEYQGGGYFRKKGVKKCEVAEILHGQQAIEYLYNEMTKPID